MKICGNTVKVILYFWVSGLLTACSSISVVGVSDGDTLTVLLKPSLISLKVRISAIDAPEKGQAFGEQAKQELSTLCFKRSANLVYVCVISQT